MQQVFEDFFTKNLPQVQFVGEEDSSFKLDSQYLTDKYLNFTMKDVEDLNLDLPEIEYNSSELTLFIDPIDSTSSFIKKKFEPVTNMVGFTKDNKPILGFLNYYSYQETGQQLCFFSVPGAGVKTFDFGTEKTSDFKGQAGCRNVAARTRKENKEMDKIMEEMGLETARASGIGNKCIYALREGCFLLGSESIGLWDSCAGHAILKEAGGDLLNMDGTEINYAVTQTADKSKLVVDQVLVGCISREELIKKLKA